MSGEKKNKFFTCIEKRVVVSYGLQGILGLRRVAEVPNCRAPKTFRKATDEG